MSTELALGLAGLASTLLAALGAQWMAARSAEKRERLARNESARRVAFSQYLTALTELSELRRVPEEVAEEEVERVRRLHNTAANDVALIAGSTRILNLLPEANRIITEMRPPEDFDSLVQTFVLEARTDLGLEPVITTAQLEALMEMVRREGATRNPFLHPLTAYRRFRWRRRQRMAATPAPDGESESGAS